MMVISMGGGGQAHEDEERYSRIHFPNPESHKIKVPDGRNNPKCCLLYRDEELFQPISVA